MQQTEVADLTLVKAGIHNPSEPRHFMRLKPMMSTVRVFSGDQLLAQTDRAIRLLEVGRDLYDPVIYVPLNDIVGTLVPIEGNTTHCPLKGDAQYFALSPEDAANDRPVAWSYPTPFGFADELSSRIAFYAAKVRIEETGVETTGLT